jgi:hypothetical protein
LLFSPSPNPLTRGVAGARWNNRQFGELLFVVTYIPNNGETSMRKLALVASAASLAFAATLASAQTPAQPGPQNPAMQTQPGNNSDMPVKGANSFTASEAKSRIADKGYTNIGALKKDNAGVWRGMATKDGQRVNVSVDYQGNVNAN